MNIVDISIVVALFFWRNMDIEPRSQIDSLLAQSRQNHYRLTQLTDTKAHILIVISAFTLNLSVSVIGKELYQISAIITIIQSLLVIIFSSVTIMPKFSGTKPQHLEVTDDKFIDSSFATGFIRYDYSTYLKLMMNTFADPMKTYEMQLREIYDSGCILVNKKFRYLRYAFLTFMIGTGIAIAIVILRIIFGGITE